MTNFLIGTGGWAYFYIPKMRSLEAYARAFNFVEVNSTFYTIPSLQLVNSWRKRVSPDFEFSVRCHRDITHRFKLEPITEVFNAFNVMIDICRILNSKLLVLVTPSTFKFNKEQINSAKVCFNSINLKGIRLVWETRRQGGDPLPSELISLMKDYNIVHCVDLSKEEPILGSDILYTRLFGRGEHNIYQFTDEELMGIDEKITSKESDTAVISFHNVKMYKDGSRYKIYRQTKKFPPVTRAKGQESLKEVLMEDTTFPSSKQELIRDQGWKIIDLAENKKVRINTILETLPNKNFQNIKDVIMNLPKQLVG